MIHNMQDVVGTYGSDKDKKKWNVDCLHKETRVASGNGSIYVIFCLNCPGQWDEDGYEKMREVQANG